MIINILDVLIAVNNILSNLFNESLDMNNDNLIDILDVLIIINIILNLNGRPARRKILMVIISVLCLLIVKKYQDAMAVVMIWKALV